MKEAELIFVPLPSIGHLVSTLEFTKRLIDRDDRISIAVLVMKLPLFPHVDAYTKSVAAAQPRIRLIELPQVDSPPLNLRKSCSEYFNYLFVESQVANVRHVVSEIVLSRSNSDSVRVTGLVVDMFCVSFTDIAIELGLPSYVYFASNTGFLSVLMDIPTHQDEIEESSNSELLIPGIVNPVPVSVLPQSLFTINKDGYSTYIKLAQKFKNVNGILVNTFFELEQYAVNSFSGGLNPPVYTIGPVLDLQGQPNPNLDEEQCRKNLKWLDDQPESSVVFLCFGSGGCFGPAQVKEMAIGLEQKQQLNAFRMVKELGLAVELRLDSKSDNGDLVTAAEISRAVRCVMDGDSEIRKKVKNMADISRKSLLDGGSSFVSVKQFIDLVLCGDTSGRVK
ncbi:hypothetical protein QYF36_010889 [Acer negundo]|nr:hypothetical protein QYF36_010889 [Acer negundo]